MKKFTRVLCVVLSAIMVFSVIAVAAACGGKKPEKVKITYYDGNRKVAEFEVETGKKIPDDKVAPDPKPASDKVFVCWSDNGERDFVKDVMPTKETSLVSVYRDRAENEVVVVFNTDGGNNIKSQVLTAGNNPTKPADPTKADAEFDGWQANGKAFDFDKPVYEDVEVKALWNEGKGKTLVLSSGNFDKVFSPFFATSAYDSEISGATQISMISANPEGKPYADESSPTVARSFSETIYVGNRIDPTGDEASGLSTNDKNDPDKCRTEYKFVIKNGIRFSDGTPLTIQDVLFNLYVYLDPTYTGSSTIYSTKIKGLNAYRTQDPDAVEGAIESNNAVDNNVSLRIANLRQYFDLSNPEALKHNRERIEKTAGAELKVFQDLQRLRVNLWKELWTEWNSSAAVADIEKDYEDYGFKESWEVFLFNVGYITAEYDRVTGEVKIEDGKPKVNYGSTKSYHHDAKSLITLVFNSKLGLLTMAEQGNYEANKPGFPVTDLPIDAEGNLIETEVFKESYFGTLADKGKYPATKTVIARAMNNSLITLTVSPNLYTISRNWGAGQVLLSYINAAELSEFLKGSGTGGLRVPNISGITVEKTVEDEEEFDVLKIVVVGVDPKAIWNFGFTVAPMHYYSDPSGKGFSANDGFTEFAYPGVKGQPANVDPRDAKYHLGFKQLDLDYIQGVINHMDVQSLPMGAGTFMASNFANNSNVTPSTFCANNIVHMRRNNNFVTTGKNMNNARFEFLKYQVVDISKVMENLSSGSVHFGDPSATPENVSFAQTHSKLTGQLVANNGFGYVGVNAKFVPDLAIRKAIMIALDTEIVRSFYKGTADILTRPMSSVSWAYPHNTPDAYPYGSDEAAIIEITKLVKSMNYTKDLGSEGAWGRNHTELGRITLKYDFIVAGTSLLDHPAGNMFQNAKRILEQCGFKINVKNDAFALSKLATGGLAVWAAAWGGGLDPDMYQVYHYQSTASSIKNWGYPEIMQYGTELEKQDIITLGRLIEQGRQTTLISKRIDTYREALNKVMDLAVEYPTYQRGNLFVYDKTKIDGTSLNTNATAYTGLLAYIWQVRLLK